MRVQATILVFCLFTAGGALAQMPAAPDMKTFASSKDVTALIAKARRDLEAGELMVSEPIVQLDPYQANLEYRVGLAPAAVHEKEAELMYVIDGSGTIVTGGKLVGETRKDPTDLSGTAIRGGTPRPVVKGDFIFVPQNTPHWFSAVNGTLILMTMHVPRPVHAP